jgi:TRAP transporter 4TM/12TM fusion protein
VEGGLTARSGRLAPLLAAGLSGYSLYWVLVVVQPQVYRVSFLLVALVLTFLIFPASSRSPAGRVSVPDWLLIAATVVALGWPLADFSRLVYRAAEPLPLDILLGAVTIAIVLEAARRTIGWVLPATAIGFLAYAWLGPWLDRVGLSLIAHRGYGPDRLVGSLYMTLEGLFGVPLDVAATYIILFTIYGAALEQSGAGRFFIDWALSASGRSTAAAGRSVTLAGFLLGTVSGSGVATTVMLGSVAWPILRRAGYTPERAGAMLSASGIGALLSPPTLGAAAFLIAEFLQISYLQVLVMAAVPTLLYYLSILLMVEGDARSLKADAQEPVDRPKAGALARRYWYHFTSLVAIAALMAAGASAFRAVFWATVLAVALSYLTRETALTPSRLVRVLQSGARDVLGVTATTATAGIIVGVVTLTGLGLKIAGLIVSMAGGTLFLTVVYSAVAVWLLGLAVPVTASYIIAAVMVAPALTMAGVPPAAAHMFIFYYAVLSEVSPPTALSPFAAAAITGANPFRTMVLTWRYTVPAFVVPFAFTISPRGTGILLQGSIPDIAATIATTTAAVIAFALASGAARAVPHPLERIALAAAGVLFLQGSGLAVLAAAAGSSVVLILQFRRHRGRTEPVGRQ